MMWLAIDAAISAFDMYVITSFYYNRLEKRVSFRLMATFSVICAAGQYVLHNLGFPEHFFILSSAAVCFIITLAFHASWKQRLFYPMLITVLEIVAELAAGLILSGVLGVTVNEITIEPKSAEYLIGMLTAKLIFFIFIRGLCRLYVMNDIMLPRRHWLLIMLSPVISVAICVGLAFSSQDHIMSDPIAPFLILAGILGINVLTFSVYDILSTQSKRLVEHERARNRMTADLRRYEAMVTQSREIAALLHDSRKHRDTVYDLLAAGNASAALSYVKALRPADFTLERKEDIDSHNPAVETILHRKTDEAVQPGRLPGIQEQSQNLRELPFKTPMHRE